MNFFKKLFNRRIPFKCNYCGTEVNISLTHVKQLETEKRDDSVCPLIIEYHYCHMGYVIPINYTSKNGITYKFDDLWEKVPTLDSDTLFDRLLDPDNF